MPTTFSTAAQAACGFLTRKLTIRLMAYCLMPNHWHMVFWPRRGADNVLSALMRRVGTTHVRRWHKHRQTAGSGPVYQGRFKSFPIERDDHLLSVCRYVERNALRARLVEKAEAWRFSSLWLRERTPPLSEEEAMLQTLLADWPVPRPVNWLSWVNRPQSQDELDALRLSAKKGRPYGSPAWVEHTAIQLGLTNTLRQPGRPRKARR